MVNTLDDKKVKFQYVFHNDAIGSHNSENWLIHPVNLQ